MTTGDEYYEEDEDVYDDYQESDKRSNRLNRKLRYVMLKVKEDTSWKYATRVIRQVSPGLRESAIVRTMTCNGSNVSPTRRRGHFNHKISGANLFLDAWTKRPSVGIDNFRGRHSGSGSYPEKRLWTITARNSTNSLGLGITKRSLVSPSTCAISYCK